MMDTRGLTEFQKDLLTMAQTKLPKESVKIMRKIGSKARTRVARKARSEVKKVTGNYHKRWKRGKVFKGQNGEWVVRVINSSPHAHLIEDGHRMVTHDGKEVGFVPGKKVLEKGMRDFDDSGQFEDMLSIWLDDMLESGKL
ncbi:HK97 gp10 family phage protein [Priestia abyssalis]|uniref:HK97 gp10 family phage protein n=1 Tax=Priestia abyssalis TaxID=1221450 RepID=UPI0009957806|nr:HK97 gp10 family phage protein [Priestia abyssalis]